MSTPPAPAAPALAEPSGCCALPPTLSLSLDIVRNGALNCSDTTQEHKTATLTAAAGVYTGSFTYAGDTYDVYIDEVAGSWRLRILNLGGCGFANCAYQQTAAWFTGPWPNDDVHAPGVCGCGDLHINYTGILVS